MVSATALLVVFVPLFYVLIQRAEKALLGKSSSKRPPLAIPE
jgi:hypothetical protein